MKRIVLFAALFVTSVSHSQELRAYIFPEGIRKTTFSQSNADGSRDENFEMIYEYLIGPEGATVFVSNYFQNNVVSRKKEEYYITDTAIYLVNINIKNILSYNQENYMGYKNCFLKLPAKGETIWWAYKVSDEASYKCSATMTKITISNIQYDAIKVDKTPFDNGKYFDNLKTSVYYVKEKGLYKEVLTSSNNSLYVLYSTQYDVSKNTRHEPTPESALKTDSNELQFGKVEIEAEFPGGSQKYIPFLYKNLIMPKAAEDNSVNGTVMVSFVVKDDGSIDNIKVEESLGFGCDEEAVRLVKLFPKWKPAMNYGKNVASIKRLPISFRNTVKDDK